LVDEPDQLKTRIQQIFVVLHLLLEEDLIIRRKLIWFFSTDVQGVFLGFFDMSLKLEDFILDQSSVFLNDFVSLENVIVLNLDFIFLVNAVIDLVLNKLAGES
jgi:hypothetical protein